MGHNWNTRFSAAVVALAVGALSVPAPAHAFAPPLALTAGNAVLNSSAGAYASALAPIPGANATALFGASALAVGALAGYSLMGLVLGDGQSGVAIPLTSDPAKQVPPPAAAPSVALVSMFQSGYGWTSSAVDACSTLAHNSYVGVANDPSCAGQSSSYNIANVQANEYGSCSFTAEKVCSGGYSFGAVPVNTSVYKENRCPNGYSLTGSGPTPCNITDPRTAQPDNRNDVLRSGNAFSFPNDADSTNSGIQKGRIFTTTEANDTYEVIGTNSSGQPISIRVQAQSGGGSAVSVSQQIPDALGNSFVTERQLVISGSGQVVSDAQTTSAASLAVDPTTNTSTKTTAAPGTSSPYVQPSSSQQQQPITVNTCGLPGQPACAIDDSGFSASPTLSIPSETLNAQKTAIENITSPDIGFSWLPSLMPGPMVACTPLQFRGKVDAFGWDATETLDLCPYLEFARQVLGYLFHIAGIIYIWRRFSNSNAGAA